MEMEWHPIEDGNMEELNGSAQYIFTVEIIPMEGKPVRIVTIGVPYEMSGMKKATNGFYDTSSSTSTERLHHT